MTDNQKEKNQRLLKIREALGMTQAEMADLLQLNRSNLSKIEKGVDGRNVPKDTIYILAREKGVNFKWFETGEGPMFIENFTPNYPQNSSQQRWFGETDREEINKKPKEESDTISITQKLLFALERNQEVSDKAMKALEKNVELLEEISNLKDLLMERERELYHIKSPEKNGTNDHIGTR